jgi:hypothetical protein
MAPSQKIPKTPLNNFLRQLAEDIQAVAEGDCQLAVTDSENHCKNYQVRIGYSVKQLFPERGDMTVFDGGSRR